MALKTQYAMLSLNEVDARYRSGSMPEDQVIAYIRLWNAGPHFTQAVLKDGGIRTFDPCGPSAVFYRHMAKEFNLKLEA